MTSDALSTRWQQLTTPLVPDAALREAIFQELAAAYQGPARHYHTLAHIKSLLDRVEGAPLLDGVAVQLAVWFHDAVYKALKTDNEAQSAALALKFLRHSSLTAERQQYVAYLIERTQDHTQPQPAGDPDLLYFLDVDLSILGAPVAEYWAYSRQVRQEYWLVPDVLYRTGRHRVLAKLLAAPVLFHTPALRLELDAVARHNMQAELLALEQGRI
jgi:predicted metal-dependent HD superfamily phosphohydrolase